MIWLRTYEYVHRTRLNFSVLKWQRLGLEGCLCEQSQPIVMAKQTTVVAIQHATDILSFIHIVANARSQFQKSLYGVHVVSHLSSQIGVMGY